MNALMQALPGEEDFEFIPADERPSASGEKWELKKLKPVHRQIAALVAQGEKNVKVAALCGVTPQYITMLLRQPIFIREIQDRAAAAGIQLEALFAQSVEVLGDVLKDGSEAGKLKASRLVMEATKRIGSRDAPTPSNGNTEERLFLLANRLVDLLPSNHPARIFEHETPQAETSSEFRRHALGSASEEAGPEAEDSEES